MVTSAQAKSQRQTQVHTESKSKSSKVGENSTNFACQDSFEIEFYFHVIDWCFCFFADKLYWISDAKPPQNIHNAFFFNIDNVSLLFAFKPCFRILFTCPSTGTSVHSTSLWFIDSVESLLSCFKVNHSKVKLESITTAAAQTQPRSPMPAS